MCEIYTDARRIAGRGVVLDDSACMFCGGDLSKCPFYVAPVDVLNSPADRRQDAAVAKLEGVQQVDRFYQKLVGHFQTEAVVENQQRSAH